MNHRSLHSWNKKTTHSCTLDDTAALTPNKIFVVKVQLGMSAPMNRTPMLVYNEARTYQTQIDPSHPQYNALHRLISQHGVVQLKGYFNAILDTSGNVRIEATRMQPPKRW